MLQTFTLLQANWFILTFVAWRLGKICLCYFLGSILWTGDGCACSNTIIIPQCSNHRWLLLLWPCTSVACVFELSLSAMKHTLLLLLRRCLVGRSVVPIPLLHCGCGIINIGPSIGECKENSKPEKYLTAEYQWWQQNIRCHMGGRKRSGVAMKMDQQQKNQSYWGSIRGGWDNKLVSERKIRNQRNIWQQKTREDSRIPGTWLGVDGSYRWGVERKIETRGKTLTSEDQVDWELIRGVWEISIGECNEYSK